MLHCTPALICCLSTLLKEYLLFLVELDKPADPGKTSCTSCGGPQPIPGDLEQKKAKKPLARHLHALQVRAVETNTGKDKLCRAISSPFASEAQTNAFASSVTQQLAKQHPSSSRLARIARRCKWCKEGRFHKKTPPALDIPAQ